MAPSWYFHGIWMNRLAGTAIFIHIHPAYTVALRSGMEDIVMIREADAKDDVLLARI
jgi:hypothetical protein